MHGQQSGKLEVVIQQQMEGTRLGKADKDGANRWFICNSPCKSFRFIACSIHNMLQCLQPCWLWNLLWAFQNVVSNPLIHLFYVFLDVSKIWRGFYILQTDSFCLNNWGGRLQQTSPCHLEDVFIKTESKRPSNIQNHGLACYQLIHFDANRQGLLLLPFKINVKPRWLLSNFLDIPRDYLSLLCCRHWQMLKLDFMLSLKYNYRNITMLRKHWGIYFS